MELRRIGRVSLGFRLSGRDEDGFELDKWEFFRHSGHESAKRYGKRERRSREELLRFDVRENWRDFNELSVIQRLRGLLRRLWAWS